MVSVSICLDVGHGGIILLFPCFSTYSNFLESKVSRAFKHKVESHFTGEMSLSLCIVIAVFEHLAVCNNRPSFDDPGVQVSAASNSTMEGRESPHYK